MLKPNRSFNNRYTLRRAPWGAPRPPVVLAAQPFWFWRCQNQGAHWVRPGWPHPTSYTCYVKRQFGIWVL